MRRPLSSRARLLAGLAVPLVGFLVLKQLVGNSTTALAITDALPLVALVVVGIWKRHLERIALLSFVTFGVALALSIELGGSPLPLELRRAVFPGAIGLACLASIAVGRPLLVILAARRTHTTPSGHPTRLNTPGARRSLTTMTALIGITGTLDAAAQIVLAFAVSTTSFVALARIVSYTIIGIGVAVGALYVRRIRARLRAAADNRAPTTTET